MGDTDEPVSDEMEFEGDSKEKINNNGASKD
jgi:hypothetical protein